MIKSDRLDQIDWDTTLFAIADNGEPMSWNLFLAFIPLAFSQVLFYRPQSLIGRWGIWILLGITAVGSYPRFQPVVQSMFYGFQQNPWGGLGAIALCCLGLAALYSQRHHPRLRLILWWIGVAIFIAFLPNAAYILTDFIHLVFDIRKGYPMGTVMLFLIPQYLLFIVAGFEAYVVSIMNLEFYLLNRELGQYILLLELFIHGLSAIGVYLGRFARLNSWDLLLHPDHLFHLLQNFFLGHHSWVVVVVLFIIFFICHRLLKRINLGLMQQKNAFRALG